MMQLEELKFRGLRHVTIAMENIGRLSELCCDLVS